MNYAFLSHILAGHWMMTPETALASQHLLYGLLQGFHMEKADEDPSSIPYMVSLNGETRQNLSESESASDEKFVSVIPLFGTVLKHDGICGHVGTRTIAARFRNADNDPSVIGHILKVESGGGLASAVPEMADTLSSLKKPVVAWIDGLCGSAAYYIASYCEKIVASHKEDQVGCIGVMISLQGYEEYYKNKDGFVTARIYSSLSNEKNRDYEEALKGNFNLIRETLDPMAQQFQEDVKANRTNVKVEHLQGRTYRAEDVIDSLIDSIGPLQNAIDTVVELAQENNNHNTTSTMENYENLQALEGVGTLEQDADGMVTLNGEQLQAIDTALADRAAITQERDDLQTQVSDRDNTITERDSTIETLNTRITELEELIKSDAADEHSAPLTTNDEGQSNPMNDCLEHIKNFG